jgi:cytochrome c oxidase subunit 2
MVHFLIVGVLVILSTWGIYTWFLNNETLLPDAASNQAIYIDEIFNLQWLLMAFFFSLIVVFVLYSVIVFRRKKGETGSGAYFEGNTTLEIVWTIIPLAVVLFLSFKGAEALGNVERRDPEALEVTVIASQWNWRFEYPESNVVSPELYLPVNRQVLLRMRSEDVIHSFWVPEFRVKQDILPGDDEYVRELRITPNETGTFTVRCAELCGQLHYSMVADVVVVAQSEFDNWLEFQAGECDLGPESCGERWATQQGCIACHSTDGTRIVGPTWLELFGSEVSLEDGSTVLADEEYLVKSIIDPNVQVRADFLADVMPKDFGEKLSDEQINDIIAFIQSLE